MATCGTQNGHGRPQKKQRVAVVGSGLAGLASAYLLHNDKKGRFEVEIFEMGKEPSFDTASTSVSYTTKGGTVAKERIDVPMRALSGGYYPHVLALYKYMGVPYRAQKFLFAFSRSEYSRDSSHTQGPTTCNGYTSDISNRSQNVNDASKSSTTDRTPYFIHSSNNHRFPPIKPTGVSWISYAIEVFYLWVVHSYFTLCCSINPPRRREPSTSSPRAKISRTESLREYLERIRLPQYFIVNYLLPPISIVTTCPHEALLDFPASDITEYKKYTNKQPYYLVEGGVRKIQRKVIDGIKFSPGRRVIEVKRLSIEKGILLIWEVESETGEINYGEDIFDQVVLAISPLAVGRMYKRLSKQMSKIPCCEVDVAVHYDERVIEDCFNDFGRRFQEKDITEVRDEPTSLYAESGEGVSESFTYGTVGPKKPSMKLERLLNINKKIVNDPSVQMIQLRTSTTPGIPIFTCLAPTWEARGGDTMSNEKICHLDTVNIYGKAATKIPASSLITEATHIYPSGALVTTSTITSLIQPKIVTGSRFVRVLRTPESRDVVQELLEKDVPVRYTDHEGDSRNGEEWKNGEEGVWLAGSWCWDGMVLLEGCVRSAERVARGLNVEVPWEELVPEGGF